MKRFLVIFFAVALFGAADAVSEEFLNELKSAIANCAVEFNMDVSVTTNYIINHIMPKTEKGKCVLACVMEGMKVLVDGKLDVEAFKMGNKQKWEDPVNIAKADIVVDMCNAEVSSDGKNECDFAFDIDVCFYKHAKEMGMET